MPCLSINYDISVRVKGSHAAYEGRAWTPLKKECPFADRGHNGSRSPQKTSLLESDLCSGRGTASGVAIFFSAVMPSDAVGTMSLPFRFPRFFSEPEGAGPSRPTGL